MNKSIHSSIHPRNRYNLPYGWTPGPLNVAGGVGAYGRKVRWEMHVQAASTAMNLESGVVADGGTNVLGLTPCRLSMT